MLAAWIAFVSHSAWGATYSVPGDYATITSALTWVPSRSTVLVAPGTYAETIDLANFNKDVLLIATGGPAVTTIDGGGSNRLLFINNPGVRAYAHPIFNGFTFANGYAAGTGGNGSPISINNSSPAFYHCVFRNNRSRYKGGAVLVFDGFDIEDTRVAFKDCLFEWNQTDRNGGAVLGNGGNPFLVFDGCTFRHNTTRTALSSNNNQGGAIYLDDAGGLVSRCHFTTNSANYTSGAIGILYQTWFGDGRQLVVRDSTFTGNFAELVGGRTPAYPGPTEGGALLVEDNVYLQVARCSFYDHEADSGSTIHSYRGNLAVYDCVIDEGNTTTAAGGVAGGGGIALNNNDAGDADRREATLTVSGTLIRNCSSHAGGGIFVQGDLSHGKPAPVTIVNTTLAGNRAVDLGPNSGFGSALRANLGNVAFSDGFIVNNHADIAGGVVSENSAAIAISDSFVVGNSAGINDPAFHYAGGTITTPGSTVAYNDGTGTASTAGLLAAPGVVLNGKTYLAYFVAPYSGMPSIQPATGTLPDRGGYAAGIAEGTGVTDTTQYILDSQHANQVATCTWLDTRYPYPGPAPVMAAVVEAENYNAGGPDIAYRDRSPGNYPGGGRTGEDVDVIADSGASGGAYVSYIVAGEYMDYALDIPVTGAYDLRIRVASAGAGGSLSMEVDGQTAGTPFTVPDTGGAVNWQWLTQTGVVLNAGAAQLRLLMRADGSTGFIGNIDAIEFVPQDGDGDDDGMDDDWELAHFVDLDVAGPGTDFDLDGFSDLQEFLAATNPTDPDDYLHVATLTPGPGGVTLTWESRTNVHYTIRSSINLGGGFSVLATNIPATPPANTYLDPAGLDAFCVYQVEVE